MANTENKSRVLMIIGAFFVIYVIWGMSYLAIRFTVETIPPFLGAGIRFIVAGSILMAIQVARGHAFPSRVHWRSVCGDCGRVDAARWDWPDLVC